MKVMESDSGIAFGSMFGQGNAIPALRSGIEGSGGAALGVWVDSFPAILPYSCRVTYSTDEDFDSLTLGRSQSYLTVPRKIDVGSNLRWLNSGMTECLILMCGEMKIVNGRKK